MLKLNMIGCGRLGKTLGRLWSENQVFSIGDVMTRNITSAEAAIEFIGAGRYITVMSELRSADIWLIATPDKFIAEIAQQLAMKNLIRSGNIIFHCSGALPSSVLDACKETGASIASIHPVKSFANALNSVESFPGTWCAMEGDTIALQTLKPAFENIGGQCFSIDQQNKTLYHAANVIVCNLLTALLETGMQVFERSGVPGETAMQMTLPIVQGTIDNIYTMGTTMALTGPIARGDHQVIRNQLVALGEVDENIADIYRLLSSVALQLAKQNPETDREDLLIIEKLLNKKITDLPGSD